MISRTEILRLLDDSTLMSSYQVLEFRENPYGFFVKLKVVFVNQSVLHTKEFFSKNKHKYSFHWQDENGKLIIRWDNAPFHENIETFPHHKHVEKTILPSLEIGLSDVIEYIFETLQVK